ncbi:hypothetical protein [Methanopyrus kandleri]|uniref:Uncharacterized protein n=1 Tax=Methanopyrus kandleri (strain AV19 / DSM 6324 / JCM 9639 / NBRC 100938) TaxID=190192 RepID=Q8TVU4_METKA|nr:hypothetical protein [Methanopyrus kandleri]AAM02507.1 Uncharacterized protein MK1294 [Methanopyrus kandleri AV19]
MRTLPIALTLLLVPAAAHALQPEVLWKGEFPDCPGSGFVHLVPVENEENTALLVVRTFERWSLYEVKGSEVTHLGDVDLATPRSTEVTGAMYYPDRNELLVTAVIEEEGEGPGGGVLAIRVGRDGVDARKFDGAYVHARPCPDGTILALLHEGHEYLEDEGVHRHDLALIRLYPDGRAERLVTFDVFSTLPPSALLIPGTLRIEPLGDDYLITGSDLVSMVELRRTASGWDTRYYGPMNLGARITYYLEESTVLDPRKRLVLVRQSNLDEPLEGYWAICELVPESGLGGPVLKELRRVDLGGDDLYFPQSGVKLEVGGSTYYVVPAVGASSTKLLVLGPDTAHVWEVPGFRELAVTPRLYGARVSERETGGCTVEVCAFKPSRGEEWLTPLFGGTGEGEKKEEHKENEGGKVAIVPVLPAIPFRRPGRA